MKFLFSKKARLERRIAKSKRKEAMQILIDFAEGRISTSDYWEMFKENAFIKEILIKDKTRPYHFKDSFYAPERIHDVYNPQKLQDRAELYITVRAYFFRNKMKCNFCNKDADTWYFLMTIQPDWIDIRDEEFLLKIIGSIPDDLTDEQNIKQCEDKIRAIFKYDKKPPEWLMNPDWPIVDGKPLVFKEETERIEGYFLINEFTFYDEKTKEEVIITQSDRL